MGHYEVLGVDPSASMQEIRAAYVDLARRNHPDRHAGDDAARRRAEERMREINAAWAAVGTVDARSDYDRARLERARPRAHGPSPAPGDAPSRGWRPHHAGPAEEFDERDDRPITSAGLPGWLRLAPPLLLVGGIAGFFLGGLASLPALVGLSVFSVAASLTLFLAAPLVAMASSRREDRNP